MTGGTLILHRAGPGVTVQDEGRPYRLAEGLSRGGAADRLALIEAAALLGLNAPVAALEMAMLGCDVTCTAPTRLALTGARMAADLNGTSLAPNSTFWMTPEDRLSIGAARAGTYSYLTPAGGIQTSEIIGSRAAHLTAGIGKPLQAGDELPMGEDPDPNAPPMILRVENRLSGGSVRVMPGPQSDLFDAETRARFFATEFRRARTGNRQGVRLDAEGPPFTTQTETLASDIIQPGDVQMTGDGVPYVLLSECQTMGGYPRIGTVIAPDLGRVAQAAPDTSLRFAEVSAAKADALWRSEADQLIALRKSVQPLRRDPHDIPDLLSYQLISGVVRGDEQGGTG